VIHRQRVAFEFQQRPHQDGAARLFSGGRENRAIDAVAELLGGNREVRAAGGGRQRRILVGRQRVEIVVAAVVLDGGARRRAGELQHPRRQIAEVARE
jgi:hypothetical protein